MKKESLFELDNIIYMHETDLKLPPEEMKVVDSKGELDEALTHCRESLAIFKRLGSPDEKIIKEYIEYSKKFTDNKKYFNELYFGKDKSFLTSPNKYLLSKSATTHRGPDGCSFFIALLYSIYFEEIEIDGEEDLAALPAILLAPGDVTIIYGLPDKGVLVVKPTPKNKQLVKEILNKM